STTLTAPAPASGGQLNDGWFGALSATNGDGLWARAVTGTAYETVTSVMAFPTGDVAIMARYQSGGIVIDTKPLENPATDGAGLALLRYTTSGSIVSALSSKGLNAAFGPQIAPLPNEGVAIDLCMSGSIALGPFSATSDASGTKPSMVLGAFSP